MNPSSLTNRRGLACLKYPNQPLIIGLRSSMTRPRLSPRLLPVLARTLFLNAFRLLRLTNRRPFSNRYPKEVEALAGLPAVRDMRFAGVQRQAVFGDPGSHPVERRPCLRLIPAENDKVVRVADHPVTAGLHRLIQRVQVQVAQQRRDDRSLW